MSLLKAQLFQFALDLGIPSGVIAIEAESYLCPEPSWIPEFGNELQEFFVANGIAYREGQYVCREYALTAVTLAKLVWFKTRPQDDALALGMFGMMDRQHKINVGIHRGADGSLHLAGYEPQDRLSPVKITRENLHYCAGFQFL